MDEADVNKEQEKSHSDPLLYFGNSPGEPMYEYFLDRLPADISRNDYEIRRGTSCMTFAKLILEELPENSANVYWIKDLHGRGYAFVVPKDFSDDELALNNRAKGLFSNMTVSQVRERGSDITQEVKDETWDRLIL